MDMDKYKLKQSLASIAQSLGQFNTELGNYIALSQTHKPIDVFPLLNDAGSALRDAKDQAKTLANQFSTTGPEVRGAGDKKGQKRRRCSTCSSGSESTSKKAKLAPRNSFSEIEKLFSSDEESDSELGNNVTLSQTQKPIHAFPLSNGAGSALRDAKNQAKTLVKQVSTTGPQECGVGHKKDQKRCSCSTCPTGSGSNSKKAKLAPRNSFSETKKLFSSDEESD